MLDLRHSNMQCKFQAFFVGLELMDNQECSVTRACPSTTVSFHMQLCQTLCSKCFYSTTSTSCPTCHCSDGRRPEYTSNLGRSLCRDCDKMNNGDLLALRKKRDRVTHTNLTRQPLECSKCTEPLPRKGPLW